MVFISLKNKLKNKKNKKWLSLYSYTALPFCFKDYLELVDWSGRAVLDNKRGAIPENAPAILQRLNIDPAQWLKASAGMEQRFGYAIGPEHKLAQLCQHFKQRWLQGIAACRKLYQPPAPST